VGDTRLEVFTVVLLKMLDFGDVMPCHMMNSC